jgi:DNA polymerase-4
MSAERTFEQDTINISYIKSLLLKLTEDLTFDLRKSRKLTSVVTVKLRYTNFDTHTRQKRIAYTASDHQLIKVVQELFDQVYQRRMLIRLVGVKFSGLVSGFSQIDLFEDSGSHLALNQAMDGIKRKFGKQAIQRASSLEISKKKRP